MVTLLHFLSCSTRILGVTGEAKLGQRQEQPWDEFGGRPKEYSVFGDRINCLGSKKGRCQVMICHITTTQLSPDASHSSQLWWRDEGCWCLCLSQRKKSLGARPLSALWGSSHQGLSELERWSNAPFHNFLGIFLSGPPTVPRKGNSQVKAGGWMELKIYRD